MKRLSMWSKRGSFKNVAIAISLFLTFVANSQTQVRIISPKLTDSAITSFFLPPYEHYVYLNDSSKKRNELLVYLPGTNGIGGTAAEFNMTAAEKGYHVISLIYPDSIATGSICRFKHNKYCYDNARQEALFGKDLVKGLEVSRANSIENRIIKLLQYLDKQYPSENWGQYLRSDSLVWSKIALSGQSQGCGHAVYLSKMFYVPRVIMFGGPKDYMLKRRKPAIWLAKKGETPTTHYFAFIHRRDSVGCTFEDQVKIYQLMGIEVGKDLVNVDTEPYPYRNSQFVISTATAVPTPHNAPVRNAALYKKVWEYLLTAQVK